MQARNTFCVVIDPGHGGKDPGCVGSRSKEKDINLSVSLKIGKMIEKNHPDVRVVYTRNTDVFIPLDERAQIANKQKADLFISIHTNAAKRVSASGTETYTLGLANSDENLGVAMRENSVILMEDDYLQKYEGFDPNSTESYIIFEYMQSKYLEQSVFLASEIQQHFVSTNRANRGVRQAGFLVLRKTSMPAVLVELGFISNRDEERYMVSDNGQNALAKSIFVAFSNFKSNYDRKLGASAESAGSTGLPNLPESTELPAATTTATTTTATATPTATTASPATQSKKTEAASAVESPIVYKVQILVSDKILSPKDKCFKGYGEISYYEDNGAYKYTYGETTDHRKITTMHRKALKDFKDAFIIRMKDGKRITN
ncbi:MAG: N-acetylmuramoyl-L-alanine amidase [Tannerella sp.]|nr:N-acetylmuramoyl-L-alanine amidase [Tannerella sp.]